VKGQSTTNSERLKIQGLSRGGIRSVPCASLNGRNAETIINTRQEATSRQLRKTDIMERLLP